MPKVVRRDLSTIIEADTPGTSAMQTGEKLSPCEESFDRSDISSIRSLSPQMVRVTTTVQEQPALDDSSLSIISDMSDCLLSKGTSSEEFEEIFEKLGIGWAGATLRKTKEANRLSVNSSSSSSKEAQKRYMHSTPVKSAVPNNSFVRSELSSVSADSLSLTPPSLTLITPYLNINQSKIDRNNCNKK